MSERREARESAGRSLPAWRPFGELERWPSPWEGFFADRGRLFADLFREFPAVRGSGFVPPIDLVESDSHYTLTVEIPGVQKEDVQVELQGEMLVIRGEKKSEREERKDRGRYLERSYGSFSRSFTLPADADAECLEASFQNGVLRVRVPRREAAKPKRIAVES